MGAGQGLVVTAFNFLAHKEDSGITNKTEEQNNPFEFTVDTYDVVYEQKFLGTKSTNWVNYEPDSFIVGHTTNVATGVVVGSVIKSPIASGVIGEGIGLFNQTEVQYKGVYALYQQKIYSAKITFNLLGKITRISNLQIKTQVSGYLMTLKQRIYYPLKKLSVEGWSFNRHTIQQNYNNSLPKVGGYIFNY